MNQAYPSLKNEEPSWADINVKATVDEGELVEMSDIAAINWSRSVEVGEKRGASGGRVMARTAGQGSCEASVTFYRGGLRKLKKALMAKAPTRGNQVLIGRVSFNITIQYTPLGENEIYEVELKGCRYLGDTDDAAEGADAGQIEVNVNPIEIAETIDGKEVVLV